MSVNPNSVARDYAVQFLYQCEAEKIFYFSEAHYVSFATHFRLPVEAQAYARQLVAGVLRNLDSIDEEIANVAKNWKISRMAVTDRSVLRVAIFELTEKLAPRKVAINEAIDLAKKYGSQHSGPFVNGLLDSISKKLLSTQVAGE
jgi:N utilization substance protein B